MERLTKKKIMKERMREWNLLNIQQDTLKLDTKIT